MDAIFSSCSTSITELKKNPSKVINDAEGATVAILNHNRPMAYLVPSDAYEKLMDRLDDLELASIAAERSKEKKKAIKISIDEL